jgi:type VI protein secretion system component VasF
MARDPDALEARTSTTGSDQRTAAAAGEFAAPPAPAERAEARRPRSLPLWPIIVLVIIGAVVAYLASS